MPMPGGSTPAGREAKVSRRRHKPQTSVRVDTLSDFVQKVAREGEQLYRDFAWRRTSDPYVVLVSEVMLQQTQVSRVERYYDRWLGDFPTFEALAAAPLEAVLVAWQGLGYNRRAIALKRLAERLVDEAPAGGTAKLPETEAELVALPGIGPATAAGVMAFAYGTHGSYLETNVRAVFLHELFSDHDDVSDSVIRPLVSAARELAEELGIDARGWNYALLDYGAHLKRTVPNPSRRSRHHTRQSPYEGSRRQKRARLLRDVIARPGCGADDYAGDMELDIARDILEELVAEGFLRVEDDRFFIA